MTIKETLLEQFTACYDENGWFVALKNAVKDLTAEQANWRTDNLDNSIWEVVRHLNFYNEAYLRRFEGIDYVYPTDDNTETFRSTDEATKAAWQTEIERFDSIMSEWRKLLKAASEDKFNEAVSATNKSLWSSLLAHVNVHNAHHGGQIVLLRKLQGSWDAKQGVS